MFRSIPTTCVAVGSAFASLKLKAHCAGADATSTIGYSSSEQLVFPVLPSTAGKSGSFAIVYDKRTRNPKYVIETLHGSRLMCADDEEALLKKKKRKPFYSEPSIEVETFRVRATPMCAVGASHESFI